MKIERNSLCTCGSGKKYKKCCLTLENQPTEVVSLLSEMQEECDSALSKIEAGDLFGAEIEADYLYSLYPNDHMVNFLQGACFIQKKCYQEAISFFEEAIRINPWFSAAYFNLALSYRQELNIVQSVSCFRKVIEIEGKHGDIGKLAKKELDWLETIIQKTLGLTLEENLRASTLFDEAFACLKKELHQEAISLFQQVLALNPNHTQSYANMAIAHSALGEQKIALEYLDKALLLDPTYEPAQQNRKLIIQLKEGEKNPFKMADIFYYKEKFKSENREKQKLRALPWSSTLADDLVLEEAEVQNVTD